MADARDPAIDALIASARAKYRESLPAKAAEIEALVAGGVREEARRAAHKLRGSAGTYGFVPLGEAAAVIEELLVVDGGDPSGEALSQLENALRKLDAEAKRAAREDR